jgi:hypothetical protein
MMDARYAILDVRFLRIENKSPDLNFKGPGSRLLAPMGNREEKTSSIYRVDLGVK